MRPLVTPSIEALAPYEPGKPVEEVARELGISNAIKLASNENPLGPSPFAIAAIRRALADAHRYPDASAYRLRERLAAEHAIPMQEILQGNGSNELIEIVVRTFCTPEDHVVIGEPSFVMYKLTSMAHGVPFSAVPLRDWTHDLEAMTAAVTPQTRVLFVANPNNPTGTYVGRSSVVRLLKEVPPEVVIVFDEAYVQYVDANDYPDTTTLRDVRERLIVLRTFSKVHGLAALRVGYAIGPAQLIDYMNRVRAPFNVGALAQAAAIAAIDDREHVEKSRAMNLQERARVSAALAGLGLEVAPSQANFVFVRAGRPGRELYEAMLRKGVILRPFGATPYLRITVGTPSENERMLRALAEVLA